jgi:hypothetical protein
LVREIYVPFDDLNVLLEGDAQRVFMTRQQYEALVEKARTTPQEKVPHQVAILSGQYEGVIEEGRALLTGNLVVDVLAEGLHAVPLEMSGVGLRRALLDDKPAALGLNAQQKPVLFIEGLGGHKLTLELSVPLQTAAALQTLNFQVPTPPVAQLHLAVPGNVEVKSGAEVVERTVDDDESLTRLSLVMRPAPLTLVMTLNNRLLRESQVVVARSVLVDEVTASYERLHASVSLGVLHGAVDRFRFVVPEGFEVTEVATPLLSQWAVTTDDEDRSILEARLNEATTETVVLNITATSTRSRLDEWSWPRLEAIDVAAQVAIVGLLLEEQLKAENIDHAGLIPIDNSVLASALPSSVFAAEPGAPRVRPIVAYYAPQSEFSLAARFKRPPAALNVTTNLLLTLDIQKHHVRGSFALLPESDKRFHVAIAVPAGWHVTEVADAAGQPLKFEPYAQPDGQPGRVVVQFASAVSPGQTYNVFFQAVHTPTDWLTHWTAAETEFPHFAVEDAARDMGAIAVHVLDDLRVRPATVAQLTPLDEDEKPKYGLGGVPTELAFRYESQDYRAVLAIERTAPRITARAYSFLKIESAGLEAHYEIVYDIAEARTSHLSFRLPADTPVALSISGLDGVVVSQTSSEVADGQHRWTAQLSERRQGRVRLAVDFSQRLTILDRTAQGLSQAISLPLPVADQVAYQTGLVAVEGSAELAVEVTRHPRRVDVGELVDAQYQPGRRLLGSFGYVGSPPQVQVSVTRQPSHSLPAAIVERCELVTLVAPNGTSQSAARYHLRTKVPLLEVELPAGAKLWSTQLDGQPGQPQQHENRLLVSLPPTAEATLRDLQIVYETPIDRLALWGDVELNAPRLFLRTQAGGQPLEVPMADLKWHLHLPAGYRVSKAHGTVFTGEVAPPETPLALAGAAMASFASDLDLLASIKPAREAATAAKSSRVAPHAEPPMAGTTYAYDDAPAAEATATPPAPATPGLADVTSEAERMPKDGQAMVEKAQATNRQEVTERAKQIDQEETRRQLATATQGKSSLWALAGVRSLNIDLQRLGQRVSFESLGLDPRINATLANEHRLTMLAWGLALLVGLVGLALTNRPVGTKARYVAAILIISAVLPVLGDWFVELSRICDLVFLTGCGLVVYYLAVALVRWIAGNLRLRRAQPSAAVAAAMVLMALSASTAVAQPMSAPRTSDTLLAELERLLLPSRPVELPNSAVIIPYDATRPLDEGAEGQLLVPYATYVELWNRAHPDKQIIDKPLPAAYALAGARYEATLAEQDSLLLSGAIDLDVYGDGPVTIPLALEGGVLTSATLDGKPALLRAIVAAGEAMLVAKAVAAESPPPGGSTLALLVEGKGRKRLEVSVRLKLDRRGGWRVATGRVPAALATQLVLHVPAAGTELRLNKLPDRPNYETAKAHETIETTLGAGGALHLEWRAKVAQAQVDRSLTADSTAVLDVREDGMRLHWQLKLAFRGSQRDSFTLDVPADYLVEKVTGANVRGWQAKQADQRQQLEISLLKTVRDQEEIGLELSRRAVLGQEETDEFTAPYVAVTSAVLHHGRLAVRRSPLLDLRTIDSTGLTRTDAPMSQLAAIASYDESPLGLRPYQAFQFIHTPFSLRLTATRIESSTSAEVQSLLRVTEREPTLETHVRFQVADRPLHQVRLALPASFELDRVVAPGVYQWAVTDQEQGRVLSMHLASGQQGTFSIIVSGRLTGLDDDGQMPLPTIAVLDVVRQQGQVVVQADPAYDVRAVNLQNAENILLAATHAWLHAEQRGLARLAIGYRQADYSGTLIVVPRKPQVRVLAISNIKVTSRTIEETILLDFTIREAGIREVSFILPQGLENARISAPLIRQKSTAPIAGAADAQIRVRLEFQDEVMGQLRVLVENDRLLTAEPQSAPIPSVETGVTTDRYVTLESAGSDEVVIGQSAGLDPISRQQSQWRTLTGLLGSGLTQAYVVRDSAASPRLLYQTKDRAAVQTVGARIGLAETLLLVDASGAYRGAVDYQVENTTEQFLDVRLPAGAQLWTARVAGEAVKPVERSGAAPGVVSIPLIKTAVGDQDYQLALKYGGRLPRLALWRQVDFPLLRTVNINVELSQVRLRLPETHHWIDFDGTMRRVEDEADLTAGYLSYRGRQIERLSQILSGESDYSKARAANNLKQLQVELDAFRSQQPATTEQLQMQFEANAQALEQGQQIVQQQQQAEAAPLFDNRARLNDFYSSQQTSRAKNVVTDLEGNFQHPSGGMLGAGGAEHFNQQWLLKNQLDSAKKQPDSKFQAGRVQQLQAGQIGGVAGKPGEALPAQVSQPQAAGVAHGASKALFERKALEQQSAERGAIAPDDAASQLRRYQDRLEKANAAPAGPYGGMGLMPGSDADRDGAAALQVPGASARGGAVANGVSPAINPTSGVATPASLASLDVELPPLRSGYREVLFTTPRGEVEITARAVSEETRHRATRLAAVLVVALLVWLAVRGVSTFGPQLLTSRVTALVLILAGLLSLITAALPLVGLAALLGGIALLAWQFLSLRYVMG